MATRSLREQLSVTATSAAGAYGYTISLGGSIAVAAAALDGPALLEALAMMTGAVLAFAALELWARGSLDPHRPDPDRPSSVFGNAHILSAGAAICAGWAVVHVASGPLAWGLMGFWVTALYFMLTSAQRIAVARWQDRHVRGGPPHAPDDGAG